MPIPADTDWIADCSSCFSQSSALTGFVILNHRYLILSFSLNIILLPISIQLISFPQLVLQFSHSVIQIFKFFSLVFTAWSTAQFNKYRYSLFTDNPFIRIFLSCLNHVMYKFSRYHY